MEFHEALHFSNFDNDDSPILHILKYPEVTDDSAMQAYASVLLNADLGRSVYVYGLGSGIFFLGYMVFQVQPSLQYSYVSPPVRKKQSAPQICTLGCKTTSC